MHIKESEYIPRTGLSTPKCDRRKIALDWLMAVIITAVAEDEERWAKLLKELNFYLEE
jgi:hypothetical protein